MGEDLLTGVAEPGAFVVIGKDTADGAEHALYDPRAFEEVSAGMVQSIREHGVLQPVTVSRADLPRLVVIDGRQRVNAARKVAAGGKSVQIPWVARDYKRVRDVVVVVNEVRVATRPSVKMAAIGADLRSHPEHRRSGRRQELASIYGCTTQTIRNYEAMDTRACPELKYAVDEGVVTFKRALVLMEGTVEQQKAAVRRAMGDREEREEKAARAKPRSKKEVLAVLDDEGLSADYKAGIRWALAHILGDGAGEAEKA